MVSSIPRITSPYWSCKEIRLEEFRDGLFFSEEEECKGRLIIHQNKRQSDERQHSSIRKKNYRKEFWKKQNSDTIPDDFSFLPVMISLRIFWIFGILGAMAIGGITAFFFFYFKVATITIDRVDGDENIRYSHMRHIFEYAKGYNIWVVGLDFLEESFLNRFPELSDIEIQKQFPRTLSIKPIPDTPKVRWIYTYAPLEQQLFGYMTEKKLFLPHGQESLFPVFDIQPRTQKIEFYTSLPDGVFIPEILSAKKEIERITEVSLVSAEYFRDAQEIHLEDENGIKYWIFLGEEISTQTLKLKLFWDHYPKKVDRVREYIDLRIGERVIYK